MSDEYYMRLALNLAEKGRASVSPNPMVGCVIVKDDQIVGQGYHQKSGLPHAEINALNAAGINAKDATMYVTLEPCCHQGKTPPCTEAIIRAGIKRVVTPHADPNPMVNGRGFEQLRQHGITVDVGLLAREAGTLNEAFNWYITHNRPFVVLKLAATLDGRIATVTGSSRWITNEKSRQFVHEIRHSVDAVVTGIGTVLADDPQLTVRGMDNPVRQPLRIVLDSRLQIPDSAQLLRHLDTSPTVIVTTAQADPDRLQNLKDTGAQLWVLKQTREGHIDLGDFLYQCGQYPVTSLLVEGGRELASEFLRQRFVNKLLYFIAPKLIGSDGLSAVNLLGVQEVQSALTFNSGEWRTFDNDFLFTGYLQ